MAIMAALCTEGKKDRERGARSLAKLLALDAREEEERAKRTVYPGISVTLTRGPPPHTRESRRVGCSFPLHHGVGSVGHVAARAAN